MSNSKIESIANIIKMGYVHQDELVLVGITIDSDEIWQLISEHIELGKFGNVEIIKIGINANRQVIWNLIEDYFENNEKILKKTVEDRAKDS